MEYASKGVSGTALGLGIAGTALGILDGLGGIGALLGNRQPVAEGDRPVTRYEMGLYQTINAKDTEIAQGALKTHGAFPVTVPAIPFISPAEKILSFSADDIATLKQYIEGGKAQ